MCLTSLRFLNSFRNLQCSFTDLGRRGCGLHERLLGVEWSDERPTSQEPSEAIRRVSSGLMSLTSEFGASKHHYLEACLSPHILVVPKLGEAPTGTYIRLIL